MPVEFDLIALEKAVRGRRLGVITTPAAWLPGHGPFMDYLLQHAEVKAFLALEHGLRGELQDGVHFASWTDPRSGCPVFSFDRPDQPVPPEFFAGIDLAVFHVQDVSHRAYTFHGAMATLLETAAAAGKSVLILDRPTPLAHLGTQGPIGRQFFPLPFPVFPSLTQGELALWFMQQRQVPVDLQVLAPKGWNRRTIWAQTKLPWIPPSPNIPTVDSVYAYACTGIFQATSVAEGRGTCKPFEYIGAPFIKAPELTTVLNACRLPGVVFREVCFQPGFNQYAGEVCHGVHLIITEHRRLQLYRTMLVLLQETARLHPRDFTLKPGFKDWLDNGEWSVEKLVSLDLAAHLAETARDAAAFRRETAASELYV